MFARTPRLTLRPGWPEDAAALTAAIAHEAVVFELARVPWPYTRNDAEHWLARAPAPRDVTLHILAHDGPVPRLIGAVGVHPAEGAGAHELGYWLTPAAWGHGYATEAGHAMLAIARHAMGLRQLASSYFVDNPASGRVLAKLGFRETATVVQRHCRALGTERPCALVMRDLMDEPASLRLAA